MAAITLKAIPPALHRRLKSRALKNRRSLNQEVLAMLEAASAPPQHEEAQARIERNRRVRESLNIWAAPKQIDAFKREGRA